MNKLYILLLVLNSTIFYGQNAVKINGPNIIFEPNVNYKAKDLRQGLNKNGDTLKLQSTKHAISQIDIFNEDYLESVDVNSNETSIALDTLPAGKFIIQARLGRKRIIMHLVKEEDLNVAAIEQTEEMDIEDAKTLVEVSSKKMKPERLKKAEYYWVVYESNTNLGSNRTMKLAYKDEVLELIKKNKYELESGIAQDNTLVVYAIYNKDKFMNKQFRNPKFYKKTRRSKIFNATPIYNSSEAVVNQTQS